MEDSSCRFNAKLTTRDAGRRREMTVTQWRVMSLNVQSSTRSDMSIPTTIQFVVGALFKRVHTAVAATPLGPMRFWLYCHPEKPSRELH